MNERQKRLNQVFDYLRLNGKMKTQKDFAEAIGVQRTGISACAIHFGRMKPSMSMLQCKRIEV